MTQRAFDGVGEAARLAVAVLIYLAVEPRMVDLVKPLPSAVGALLSVAIGAVGTVLLVWVLNPVTVIELQARNVITRQSITGPVWEVTATEYDDRAARFDFDVRAVSRGLLARVLLRRAMARQPGVEVRIATFRTTVETRPPQSATGAIPGGLQVRFDGHPPAEGTWTWCGVTLATEQLPDSGTDATVTTRVVYARPGGFAYRWFVRVTCPLRILRITKGA